MPLRVVFAGTPAFAVPPLAALQAAYQVVGVLTQPDRPAGRGRHLAASPVKQAALAAGIPVAQPEKLRGDPVSLEATLALLREWRPDVMVVVAYGLILPRTVLQLPRLGCLNIHASLLPRWRGAAPIQRAILAGDRETGVTIMQMDAGLDTGPMLLREAIPIARDDTGGSLHDGLAALGSRLIVDALARLEAGTLTAAPQPGEGVTYAAKIDKAEARLDWRKSSDALARVVRAFAPAPGAWFELPALAPAAPERVRVLAGDITAETGAPGAVLDEHLTIACGAGALRPTLVQRAGKAAMDTDAFLRGRGIPRGTVLP
jgi:methionyl-tRNA formyltransferase